MTFLSASEMACGEACRFSYLADTRAEVEEDCSRTSRGSSGRLVRLICTGCHTIQPKLTGNCKGKVDVFNLAATRELPALVTSGLSFTLIKRRAPAHWLADAVHLFGLFRSVFGTDVLKPMPVLTVRQS